MTGTRTALHEIYHRHAADVFRYALFLCGNYADAEDITSETFVRLWTAPGEIRTASVKAYLFTIARNLYLDGRRARARLTPLEADVPSTEPSPEVAESARSEVARVRAAIQQLPDDDRTALLMRAGGLPYEDIAQALRASVGAIKVRVHRARKRLIGARHSERSRS
jgi:RNA polymerase sigma-70 factor (ECF subfamily)